MIIINPDRKLTSLGHLLLCQVLLLLANSMPSVAYAESPALIEEIIVTARKKAEPLLEVPLAITALDNEALLWKQVEGFSDLQLHVPNVSYSKTNFARSNFQIRGIGSVVNTPTVDFGVGFHVNDVFLNIPRIAETEFYDLEQVEVLRGPQGTLFGRNSTGGAINMRTARPVPKEFSGFADLQLGNYDTRRAKGAVNVPINDQVTARIAGIWLDREGYTKNLATGNDIDDRSQWSVRGSLRYEFGEASRLDLIAHRFREQSARTRSQKQLCKYDPSAILGCLPDSLATEPVNNFATSGYLFSSNLILGPLGVFDFFDQQLDSSLNPDDLREINARFEPEFETDEDFVMLEFTQGIGEHLTLTALANFQQTGYQSSQDLYGTAGPAELPGSFCFFSPAACSYFDLSPGGSLFVSNASNPRSLGAIGGDFELTGSDAAFDEVLFDAKQAGFEVRLASNFSGPFDYLIGLNYLDFESDGNYFVRGPTLDYPALAFANSPLAGNPAQFISLAPGYFISGFEQYELESTSAFGELYWSLSETIRLTLGLRYTEDKKTLESRNYFYNLEVLVDVASSTATFFGSDDSVTEVSSLDQLMSAAAASGDYDANPFLPGGQPTYSASETFDGWSGRLVADWQPDFDLTDQSLYYASYSRGFKAGGFNTTLDATVPQQRTFDPEDLDAYEIGTKNLFADSRVMANGTLFYYDYDNVHLARQGVVENTQASLWGAEVELVYAPTLNWVFNMQWSYLNSELEDYRAIDPADPTAGRDDVTLIKDFQQGSHCVLEHNGLPAPEDNPLFVGLTGELGIPYLPTGRDLGEHGGVPGTSIADTPGIDSSAFSLCRVMESFAPNLGYGYSSGIERDLDGNQLIQAPEQTLGLGVAYSWFLNTGMTLTARLDYYWQDEFYGDTFNRRRDLIESWDVYNAQLNLLSANETWSLTAFIKNIENEDPITGTFTAASSTGLYTNVFLAQPRLYGMTLRWQFF